MRRLLRKISVLFIAYLALPLSALSADLSGCVKEEISDLKKAGFTWEEIKLHCRPGNLLGDSMGAALPDGKYRSDFGDVEFSCNGNSLPCVGEYTGTNDNYSAKVHLDESSDGQLMGIWHEKESKRKCNVIKYGTYYWGKVSFRFSVDSRKWTGSYGYCENAPTNKWNGWR